MFINKVKIIALLSLISILMVGCNKKAEEKTNEKSLESITISGSTSVGPLMEKESERFEQLNPQVNVQINQLGSSAGIKDAINGTAIITSKDNKIDSLKLSQIRDIYTGKIRNWKDVGGKDSEIVVVSREEGQNIVEENGLIRIK